MVGTTTSARDERGRPNEKSIRGSIRGELSSVAAQLTRDTANWLAAISNARPAIHIHSSRGTAAMGKVVPAQAR